MSTSLGSKGIQIETITCYHNMFNWLAEIFVQINNTKCLWEHRLRGSLLLVGVKLAQFGKVAWLCVLSSKYIEDKFEIRRQDLYLYMYIYLHISPANTT